VHEQVEDQPFVFARQVGALNEFEPSRLNLAQALAQNFEPVPCSEEQPSLALDDAGARLGRKLSQNASFQIWVNRLSADVRA
jgi:hypothetical protein